MASSVSNEFSSIPRLLVVNGIIQLFWLPSNPSWGDCRGEDKNGDRGLHLVVTGPAGFPSVLFGFLPTENYTFIAGPRVFSTDTQLKTCVERIVCLRPWICAIENTGNDQFVCGKLLTWLSNNHYNHQTVVSLFALFLFINKACIIHRMSIHSFR